MFVDDDGNFRLGRLTLLCFAVLCFGVLVMAIARHDVQGAAAASPAAESPHDAAISTAQYECEQWTRKNSRLAVEHILDRYRTVTGGSRLKQGHFRVGLTYRAGNDGILMSTTCEAATVGDYTFLVREESGLAR